MKLQPDRSDAQIVSGYGPGWVSVNGERITHSVLIGSAGQRLDWGCHAYDELGPAHFERLASLGAEVIIFGSGSRIRFPRPQWLAPLMRQRIGVETMDSAAACRTYNILAAEGRSVLLALLLEPASP